jgi:hypothetical protein
VSPLGVQIGSYIEKIDGVLRVEAHRLPLRSLCLLVLLLVIQGSPEVVVVGGVAGVEPDRLPVGGLCLRVPLLVVQSIAEVVAVGGVAGIEPDRLPVGGLGLRVPLLVIQGSPEVVVVDRVAGSSRIASGRVACADCLSSASYCSSGVVPTIPPLQRSADWTKLNVRLLRGMQHIQSCRQHDRFS